MYRDIHKYGPNLTNLFVFHKVHIGLYKIMFCIQKSSRFLYILSKQLIDLLYQYKAF